jgi:hypothetical protein
LSRLEIGHGRVGNGVWKAGKVGKLEFAWKDGDISHSN